MRKVPGCGDGTLVTAMAPEARPGAADCEQETPDSIIPTVRNTEKKRGGFMARQASERARDVEGGGIRERAQRWNDSRCEPSRRAARGE